MTCLKTDCYKKANTFIFVQMWCTGCRELVLHKWQTHWTCDILVVRRWLRISGKRRWENEIWWTPICTQPLVRPWASCSGFLMNPPERHQRGLRPVEASCSCFPMKHLEPAWPRCQEGASCSGFLMKLPESLTAQGTRITFFRLTGFANSTVSG